jgi:hypothetical protein
MNKKQKRAFNKLKHRNIAVRESIDGHEDRGIFWIWTEGLTDETTLALDYYDNMLGSEELNEILAEAGLWFEWQNPAVAIVWED